MNTQISNVVTDALPIARVISACVFSSAGLYSVLEAEGYQVQTAWTLETLTRQEDLVVLCLPANTDVLPDLLWRMALSVRAAVGHCRLVIISDCPAGWLERTLRGLMDAHFQPHDVRILHLRSGLPQLRQHLQQHPYAFWPAVVRSGRDDSLPALTWSELTVMRAGSGLYQTSPDNAAEERLRKEGQLKLYKLLRTTRRLNRLLRCADGHRQDIESINQ